MKQKIKMYKETSCYIFYSRSWLSQGIHGHVHYSCQWSLHKGRFEREATPLPGALWGAGTYTPHPFYKILVGYH